MQSRWFVLGAVAVIAGIGMAVLVGVLLPDEFPRGLAVGAATSGTVALLGWLAFIAPRSPAHLELREDAAEMRWWLTAVNGAWRDLVALLALGAIVTSVVDVPLPLANVLALAVTLTIVDALVRWAIAYRAGVSG